MAGRLLLAEVHRQRAGEKEMAEAVLELSTTLWEASLRCGNPILTNSGWNRSRTREWNACWLTNTLWTSPSHSTLQIRALWPWPLSRIKMVAESARNNSYRSNQALAIQILHPLLSTSHLWPQSFIKVIWNHSRSNSRKTTILTSNSLISARGEKSDFEELLNSMTKESWLAMRVRSRYWPMYKMWMASSCWRLQRENLGARVRLYRRVRQNRIANPSPSCPIVQQVRMKNGRNRQASPQMLTHEIKSQKIGNLKVLPSSQGRKVSPQTTRGWPVLRSRASIYLIIQTKRSSLWNSWMTTTQGCSSWWPTASRSGPHTWKWWKLKKSNPTWYRRANLVAAACLKAHPWQETNCSSHFRTLRTNHSRI